MRPSALFAASTGAHALSSTATVPGRFAGAVVGGCSLCACLIADMARCPSGAPPYLRTIATSVSYPGVSCGSATPLRTSDSAMSTYMPTSSSFAYAYAFCLFWFALIFFSACAASVRPSSSHVPSAVAWYADISPRSTARTTGGAARGECVVCKRLSSLICCWERDGNVDASWDDDAPVPPAPGWDDVRSTMDFPPD